MNVISELVKYLNGAYVGEYAPIGEKEMKTWEGIRCKYCGALLIKGKCPVTKKDCGRP